MRNTRGKVLGTPATGISPSDALESTSFRRADGIRSAVRGMIDPAASRPRYTGLVSFGGFGRDLAPDPGTWTMTFGRNVFAGVFVPTEREVWWFVTVPRHRPPTEEDDLAPRPGGDRG